MTTPTLPLAPIRDDYSFVPGNGVVSTRLDGGASRQRLDVIGSSHTVEMQWLLTGLKYTILMGFFRDTLAEGSLPFLASLLTDIRTLTTVKCRCAGGAMPRLITNKADGYWVKGTMEVERNPTHTGVFRYSNGVAPFVDTLTIPLPEYIVGDKFRIVDSFKNGLSGANFDGVYTVTAGTLTSVSDSAGAAVNAEWSAGGFPYDLQSTITRVPT